MLRLKNKLIHNYTLAWFIAGPRHGFPLVDSIFQLPLKKKNQEINEHKVIQITLIVLDSKKKTIYSTVKVDSKCLGSITVLYIHCHLFLLNNLICSISWKWH